MAYLRRFKDSRYWFACFKGVNGKRLQRSTKETDRRLAQKIADRYEGTAAQASLGFLVERQARKVIGEIYEISTREKLRSDSVRDFFTRWLERVHVELNHKTFKRYEGVTAEFLNWLGPRASLSIAHLSSVDIVGYRDYLARKHSPSSVNISLAAIQSALGRAFDDRLVDVNEASRVPRLKDDPARKQQRRAFTERELQAILKVCDP
ncbi:MAG TPA: phage integrase SAM-like domain-containing protein, partial [Terrimicrobiaceae bacterium]|nr:phage integrase SAM-like domain-containing protein [Terrimicrobiaceae bacterium]